MRHARLDINLLLGTLLLFSLSIACLYGQNINEHPFNKTSTQNIVKQLDYLINARDAEKMGALLEGADAQKVRAVIDEIAKNFTSALAREDKLQLIYDVVPRFKDNKQAQYLILGAIAESSDLLEGKPLLLVAAQNEYEEVAPIMLEWAKGYQTKMQAATPKSIANLALDALQQAVAGDDHKAMALLFKNSVVVPQEQLNQLLWQAVEGNKNSAFVELLLKQGADVNYAHNGYSVLMKAVENNNEELVQAIAETGKDTLEIDAFYKPEIGTALQIAIEKGYANLDEYLRAHGAREDAHLRKKKPSKAKQKRSSL